MSVGMTKDSKPTGSANSTLNNTVSRRPFIKTLGAAGLATGLAGCASSGGDGSGNGGGNGNSGGGTKGSSQGGGQNEVSMTLASTFAEGHVLVAGAAKRFKEIMEEESDGNFTVQISPGGAYGAEDEISELVAEGGVESHSQGTFPFLQYAPKYFFFANPFVMKDFDHILKLHESDLMNDGYKKVMENGNQRPVGNMVYRGARHLCTKQKTGAVATPDDIKGLTLRVSEIPPWVKIFSKIGFDTTAIAWNEVYSAMQTGTAEAIEAPPGALNSARLFEVFDVLNITGHQITTGNIYLNEDFYQSLDDTYKELVQSAGDKATNHASEMAKEEEQGLIDTFKSEHGITINQDADRASFASAAEPAVKKLFDEEWAHTWEDVRNV